MRKYSVNHILLQASENALNNIKEFMKTVGVTQIFKKQYK